MAHEAALALARQIVDLHGAYFPLVPERPDVDLVNLVARHIGVVMREFTDRLGLDPDAPEVMEARRAAQQFMRDWDPGNGT